MTTTHRKKKHLSKKTPLRKTRTKKVRSTSKKNFPSPWIPWIGGFFGFLFVFLFLTVFISLEPTREPAQSFSSLKLIPPISIVPTSDLKIPASFTASTPTFLLKKSFLKTIP